MGLDRRAHAYLDVGCVRAFAAQDSNISHRFDVKKTKIYSIHLSKVHILEDHSDRSLPRTWTECIAFRA